MEPLALLPVRFRFFWLLLCWAIMPACVSTEASEIASNNSFINKRDTALRKQGGFLFLGEKKVTAWVVDINPSNDTLYKCLFIEGKEEDWEIKKYHNGQIAEQRFYKKGRKEGEHKGWFANGKPKFVYHYKGDIYEGNVKDWGTNGQLYRDYNYKEGHESGRQRLWSNDGKIKANYDVRNGRKYGLTGVKGCVNVTEEGEE